ncbi:MAG TPA: T9SS type A sorting domain-containing protein [Chitinophagales bacterium]|nr:T9SS type A sorting domain-containing protein [Chitinophagales bacterium]
MKTVALTACLCLTISQIQAQSTTSSSIHFSQNGFVRNAGQFCDPQGKLNRQVEFLYAKDDFHLALTQSGFSYELIQETREATAFPESGITDPDELQDWQNLQPVQESVARINITLKGSNPHPEIITDYNTGTLFNYYIGHLAVVNVPAYNRVTYKNIYPGIDMVFEDHHSENGNGPEYSFIVHPGADVHQIKMKYSGAGNLSLTDQHTLAIATPYGFIKETGLKGYWLEDGAPSDVSFRLKNGMLSFNAESDKSKTLIIDPSIVWGTYFGGGGSETYLEEAEIALDKNNDVFLTGCTNSSNYIATSGAVMETYSGSRDILLAEFSKDGNLLWATYFGGNGLDVAYGVYCDSYNNPVITGGTKSTNVMTTSGVFQTTLEGYSDVLIAKFSAFGQLMWCTLMGGPNDLYPKNEFEDGRSLICDANDNIYVCGYVQSDSNTATTGAYQSTYAGKGDAFLVKFSKDGQKIWGTYFSGAGQDRAHALCFDLLGHIYIIGTAETKKNWITLGFQKHYGGHTDAFIAKFDTSGNYYWSSYYGGIAQDHARGVKCDGADFVYMNGWTGSSEANVISTPGSFQQNYSDNLDGFLVKFNPSGIRVWGTYFGGTAMDQFFGMTIDEQANLYMIGMAASTSGIATFDALQQTYGGGQDAFIAMFDSSGRRSWSTYFGGTGKDNGFDIERDTSGMIYIVVDTHGPLPVTQTVYQTVVRGQDDLAVFEFDFNPCIGIYEPNENFLDPFFIKDTLTTAGITINDAVSSATDKDWFSFHLRSIDTIVTITLSGLRTNYDLEVYNSSYDLIASSSFPGGLSESITLDHDTGMIYIQIAHDSLSFTPYICYTLQIVPSSGGKLSEPIPASSNHHLKIYPNPTSGLMTAELENCQRGDISIIVVDGMGKIVYTGKEQATEGTNSFSLNLSELKPGLYMIGVQGSDTYHVMKFLIARKAP